MAQKTATRLARGHALRKKAALSKKSSCTVKLVVGPDHQKMCGAAMRRLSSKTIVRKIQMDAFDDSAEDTLKSTGAGLCQTVLFVLSLDPLPQRKLFPVRESMVSKYLFQASDLPVEAIASRLPRFGIRNNRRVHVSSDSESFEGIVYRTLAGMTQRNGPERIVDAWFEESDLVLLSPNFERMHVPLEKLEKLIGKNSRKVKKFEIDDDGSFLYWPHSDTHLGWEQFRQITDPAAVVAAKQRSTDFNEKYGAAIRAVRVEFGLTQAEIKGVTDRNLRRVEKGEIQVSKKVLESLAKAHGLSLDEYLKVLADQMK